MIPVYRPYLGKKERKYMLDAFDSTWISSKGKYIDEFEKKFAKYIGAKYAIGANNGTTALHLALAALGIGPGDEVIVPTFTYIASVNAIAYTGAKPVFIDSSPDYWNLDPNLIEKRITKKTKAIMAVHLYGHPADMSSILKIAKKYKLFVVEDAAESHGAEYKGKKVGSLGTISSFSFFGNKVITTGEGGMVLTNDKKLAEKCIHLRGQGVSPKKTYWHDVVGFNYRMTNLVAAIGLGQLEKISKVLKMKRKIAKEYTKRLKNIPEVICQGEEKWAKNVFWMYSILVPRAKRDKLIDFLKKYDIETRPFFYPAHVMPPYKEKSGKYPVAEMLGASGINLPSFPELTISEINKITSKIKEFFNK